jgi:RNA polymerase sigma factor (TIGR02999 family)
MNTEHLESLLPREAESDGKSVKPDQPTGVTELLSQWRSGDREALARLVPMVQRELHNIAARCMAGERKEHSLQATALVNEAYVRLVDAQQVQWQNRAHFLAMAARMMRRVLVDAARTKHAQKRGGEAVSVTFTESLEVASAPALDVLALDDALKVLAKIDKRKSRVIELRFFGGLSIEETSAVLGVSGDTVRRDWRLAKAWLKHELDQTHRT